MFSKYLIKTFTVLMAFSSHYLYAATCEFKVTHEWNSGFTSAVTITNDTNQVIDSWNVTMDFAGGATITGAWNAKLSGSGPYQANNENYNGTIQPNSTTSFGFNAQKATPDTDATIPTLGGICTASSGGGNNPPTAQASASPLTGNIPLTVNFDASTSSDPDGDNLSYRWEFADGTTANGVTTTRTYTAAGTYTARLIVNDGTVDSTPIHFTIQAHSPQASTAQCEYTVSNEWNTGFTSNIRITNNTGQPINDWAVSITFPDASSINHIWNADLSGNNPYQASYKNYNRTIQPNSTIEFGFNTEKSTSGAKAQPPTLGGICGTTTANQPPTAQAAATPVQGPAPLVVNFNANGSTDPDGDTLTYHWDFGDSTSSSTSSATHTYSTAGTYSAVLTVTDTANNTDTTTVAITVIEPANQSPVAQATVTPRQGVAPLAVTFDASQSTDPDGDTLTYHWDFGDSTSSNTSNASHTYASTGTYTVVLTVTDTAGNTDTATVTITVTDSATQPTYVLDATRSSLHFVSTKKVHVIETHTFTEISGDISAAGIAVVRLNLESVETGIDIRNERMREHLFETDTFSHAVMTLNVDMTALTNLAIGTVQEQDITPTVDLHGFQVQTAARVKVTRLTADTFLVQNTSPIIVKAADFALTAGIDILKNLANLSVISYSVPVNFTLFFEKQ